MTSSTEGIVSGPYLVYDLYSGAGGVGVALEWISDEFDVEIVHVGVDIEDPGEFVRADASEPPLNPVAVLVWLSPPCLAYSRLSNINYHRYDWEERPRERYPTFEDLDVHSVAEEYGEHYIIENLETCEDLRDPARVNGHAFDRPLQFKRHFETSFQVPDAIGTGEVSSRMGDNYNREELAELKGVPADWPEASVNSAIPREYVQYLLHYCPAIDGVPLPSMPNPPLAAFGGGDGGE